MDELIAEKRALRARMRKRRAELPAAEVRAASEAVCRHAATFAPLERARLVALYAAIDGEIDCAPLDALLRGRGSHVSYPRVFGDELVFHLARPLELRPAELGIPTPPDDAPTSALDTACVVVVPGVAFDRAGHRLGYGRGFYDAALSLAPRPVRVGVCHAFQIVDALPRHAGDQPVDCVVTPDGVRVTGVRPLIVLEANS